MGIRGQPRPGLRLSQPLPVPGEAPVLTRCPALCSSHGMLPARELRSAVSSCPASTISALGEPAGWGWEAGGSPKIRPWRPTGYAWSAPAILPCRCLAWPGCLEKCLLNKVGDHRCSVRLGDTATEGTSGAGGLVALLRSTVSSLRVGTCMVDLLSVQCPAWSHVQGRPVNTSA